MLAVCLCTVKRGDRIGALILIKTANMAAICTEEAASPSELEETARGISGFGSTGVGKLKRHNQHGGKADGAKKAKRQSSTESDETTSDDEESEESEEPETEYSVCDTDLD